MKNIVEIRYPQGERFPQISINGEKISRYMELSDLIYDDMFIWQTLFCKTQVLIISNYYTI